MSVSGENDLSDLFARVTALEMEDSEGQLSVTLITKTYAKLGIRVTFKTFLHTYRLCGDTNPIYPATCGTDTYI